MNVSQLRQQVLVDTLTKLYSEKERNRLRNVALENVSRWKKEKVNEGETLNRPIIRVVANDWGVATLEALKEFGEVFACLNMANEIVFGGGYVSGMVAQEENMFRRTDCHFSHETILKESKEVSLENVILKQTKYTMKERKLVASLHGECYLDLSPRICIKDKEVREDKNLGYALLDEKEIFPFYELRSAALDLRNPGLRALKKEVKIEMNRKKIKAQLDTLIKNKTRHVILSAFGCGAFLNDSTQVATIYKEEIEKVKESFDVVIFAVFYAGYGNDNFTPFEAVLMPK